MINEDDYTGPTEKSNNETEEKKEKTSRGAISNIAQIIGIEGMIIGKFSNLSDEQLTNFMTLWYPPTVEMAKSLKLDEALEEIIREGRITGSFSNLSGEQLTNFMTMWYPPAVEMAKSLKLDEALEKMIRDNPYITFAVGFGLSAINALMTVSDIKKESKNENSKTEQVQTEIPKG